MASLLNKIRRLFFGKDFDKNKVKSKIAKEYISNIDADIAKLKKLKEVIVEDPMSWGMTEDERLVIEDYILSSSSAVSAVVEEIEKFRANMNIANKNGFFGVACLTRLDKLFERVSGIAVLLYAIEHNLEVKSFRASSEKLYHLIRIKNNAASMHQVYPPFPFNICNYEEQCKIDADDTIRIMNFDNIMEKYPNIFLERYIHRYKA